MSKLIKEKDIAKYNVVKIDEEVFIDCTCSIVFKNKKTYKILRRGDWFLDRQTPKGEDGAFYERLYWGGNKPFFRDEIYGIIKEKVE